MQYADMPDGWGIGWSLMSDTKPDVGAWTPVLKTPFGFANTCPLRTLSPITTIALDGTPTC